MNQTPVLMKAFNRSPSLETSRWYMGSMMTVLADGKDTNGDFALIEFIAANGNEPPPHVHEREDELYYVLDGEFDAYVGTEAFQVKTGDSLFLPRGIPHALVGKSPTVRLLLLITPAGLEDYFRSMGEPAQKLELPTGAITYSQSDLTKAVELAAEYGSRFLSPEEVAEQLPLYPKTPRQIPEVRE